MIYTFIQEHDEHPAARWAKFFEVSTSGYYSWLEARPDRQSRLEAYAGAVEQIFDNSGGTYGADRIAGEMRKQGLKASFRKVKRVMENTGLYSVHLKYQRCLTDSRNARDDHYVNLLRDTDIREPFQVLSSDISYLPDPEKLKERIAFHERCLQELSQSGRGALLFTDPEAGMMPAKEGGMKACYNVQTAVDAESHMIVGFEVTNDPSDRGKLDRTAEQCKEELGLDSVKVIADKGYESLKDIEQCLLHGTQADVGFTRDREERVISLDYEASEITQEEKHSQRPVDIQRCLHAGVLPACLATGNIRIEVQEESAVSCFLRHEDGRVTCPMGKELFKLRDTRYGTEYSSREACRTCRNRCTDSKAAKHVNIGRNSMYVPVRMYGSSEYPLQPIPSNGTTSRNLNNFGKLSRAEKRVMIFIRRDIPKQKQRQQTSEHPFGTIKHYDGAGYFLCKGKEKVTAEYALSCLGYDIRRAVKICGSMKSLIQRYQGIAMPNLSKMVEM